MMNKGVMEARRDDAVSQSTAVDAESAQHFFGSVCAAG